MDKKDRTAQELFNNFWQGLKSILVKRAIKDVENWDGSASNYDTTADYCDACLINLNEGDREEWTQVNCKLPVRGPGDSQDTYVRQAVYAAAQRINQTDAPEMELQRAARELVRVYDEMGEDAPESLVTMTERAISQGRLHDALYNAMFSLDEEYEGSNNYFMDMYYDGDGMYALFTDRSKLYRYPVMVQNDEVRLGERVEVMEMHVPKMQQSRTTIQRQADGRYRWFSVSATAVLNRSGEIDSRELFDSFVKYAEETGKYPIRMFYHQGHISQDWEMDESARVYRTGQADFLARDGYCYITSGVYDDTPLAQAEIKARQANPDYWGDSIGFWPTKAPEMLEVSDGIRIPINNEGFNVEISTLPEQEAASLFTRTEVSMTLAKNAWEAFLKLWDEDEAQAQQWLEDNPEARNRAIEVSGMIARKKNGEDTEAETETDEAEEETLEDEAVEDTEEGQEEEVDTPELEIDDGVIDELAQRMQEAEFITALLERVEGAETAQQKAEERAGKLEKQLNKAIQRIEALEVDDDTKLRQRVEDLPAKLKQPAGRVVYRPRTREADNDAEVNEFEEWKKNKATNNIPSY